MDRKLFELEVVKRAIASGYKWPEALLKRSGEGYATTWVDMMWEGWTAALNRRK